MSNSASTKLSRLLTTAKVRTKKRCMKILHTPLTSFLTFLTSFLTFSDSHVPFFLQCKHLFHFFPEHVKQLQRALTGTVLPPFVYG